MPRQPMIGLGACAVGGILASDYWTPRIATLPAAVVLLLAGLACLSLALRRHSTPATLLLTFLVFLALHALDVQGNPGLGLARLIEKAPGPVGASGIVIDEPELREEGKAGERSRFRLELDGITLSSGGWASPQAKVLVNWCGKPPCLGDRVAFTAQASNLGPPRNPGQFNQPAYYHRQRIYTELKVRFPMDCVILSSGNGNHLMQMALRARHWMQAQLERDLEDCPEIAGVIQALVLGLKEEAPQETRELFQRTGTVHLFVVNGLHVGLFAAIVWYLLKPLGLTRQRAVFVIIPILGFYALVTGLSPGSIRATLMAAVVLGGHVMDRKPLSLNSLAAAAFAILLWDTNQLFQPGFQFSFGVVTAILLWASPFRNRLAGFGKPDVFLPRRFWSRRQIATSVVVRNVAGLGGVSLAAWIGSIPFSFAYLNLLTPSAVIANVFLVPIAFIILGQGILAMACGAISGWCASLFTNANWAAIKVLLWVVEIFARLPGGHIYLEIPRPTAPPVEITVFDFGRGGCIHLRAEGRDWLLDTGNSSNFQYVVRNYLHSRGVNQIEGLLLSHGHLGNVGAALEAVEEFRPRLILDSPAKDRAGIRKLIHDGLQQRGIPKCIISRGDRIQLSPRSTLRVLFPPAGIVARNADNRCLGLQLETHAVYPPRKILFLFDGGFPTETWLVRNEPDLKSDLLVKGMHADDLSATGPFLAMVSPRVVVCGTGGHAGFGRITDEWVRDIEKSASGTIMMRQDKTGAVQIELHPQKLTLRAYLGNESLSLK